MRNLLVFIGLLAIGALGWMLWYGAAVTTPQERSRESNIAQREAERRAARERAEQAAQAEEEDEGDEEVEIEGEFVCLPHKNTIEFVRDICAFGIQIDSGEFYQIQPKEEDHLLLAIFETGDKLKLKGTLSEPEPDQVYDIVAVLTVSEVETLEEETEEDIE